MLNKLRSNQGFTLIELLIVVAIIGILAAIAIPQFSSYQKRGYASAVRSDAKNAQTAVKTWFGDDPVRTVTPAAVTTVGPAPLGSPFQTASVSNGVTIAVSGASPEDSFTVEGTHTKLTAGGAKITMYANGGITDTLSAAF